MTEKEKKAGKTFGFQRFVKYSLKWSSINEWKYDVFEYLKGEKRPQSGSKEMPLSEILNYVTANKSDVKIDTGIKGITVQIGSKELFIRGLKPNQERLAYCLLNEVIKDGISHYWYFVDLDYFGTSRAASFFTVARNKIQSESIAIAFDTEEDVKSLFQEEKMSDDFDDDEDSWEKAIAVDLYRKFFETDVGRLRLIESEIKSKASGDEQSLMGIALRKTEIQSPTVQSNVSVVRWLRVCAVLLLLIWLKLISQ